ncbi:hypothetical protein TOPH_00781 [Tolypocladium ophioglossoides CBS 100239]|uniref:Zn(2)-C6 fungal-type domain-containing protein n=1 Tax=Tolypocladium ophioglossoides (strain CBS 100239) TaxID=1163406 RepID=A0A0L0NJK2_TOLOC|nr:hypothetical protein TOPH_00781 [Tolypocladium ophioglossoides CBS 100239]
MQLLKKKCDEARPACSRCQESSRDCLYEPVKPRVRRRVAPRNGLAVAVDGLGEVVRRPSDASCAAGRDLDELPLEADAGGFSFDAFGSDSVLDPVDDVVRRDDGLALVLVAPGAPGAPGTLPSPRLEFCQPAFYEFSQDTGRRALMDHFCNTLSHLIAVSGAIYALACAHLEVRGVEGGQRSLYYHNQSIQGLARLIEQGDGVDKNELLAAVMLLVYYEVLVQRGPSNLVDGHLRGAMAIMGRNGTAETNPTTVFLERAFRFYDVIAALSFGTAPLSSCPSDGGFAPFAPLDSRGAAAAHDSVDALLGMATSLWPVIHRLSSLLGLRHALEDALARGELARAAVLRTGFDSTCAAIEVALHEWEPILPRGCAVDASSEATAEQRRLQSIVNSALAYRHSAVVYLYRSVYGCARGHAVVQHHTRVSLAHCEATVAHGGPMGSLLWPLFVAACEAVTPADRALAEHAFAGVGRRQGMKNIERAWRVVREVWRRADDVKLDAEEPVDEELLLGVKTGLGRWKGDLWRRVSRDLGMTIIFG